ncbi:hypothetical protein [Larkinella soli]|uniref:hypothetical protein n=1 Tax=Larkinella soli TaxID=1770527 RepID=UPI000FFB732C|nr:hypothetical protein [Larkinella soli]
MQTNPQLTPGAKDTLGLIVQGLKYCYLEHYDDLKGSGQLRQTQKYHAGKLAELLEKDQSALYRMIHQHSPEAGEMALEAPLYDTYDLIGDMIATCMALSAQKSPEGGTVGIPLMREILKAIRAGQFATVEELPQNVEAV